MSFPTFQEWMAAVESSAFTRSRDAAAQKLGPKLPDASMHSRSTYPWADNVKKHGSKWGPTKKKKKKRKKKKMEE